MSVDLAQMERFILVLFRAAGMMAFVPFWGSRLISAKVKVGLCFVLAVILYPVSIESDFSPTDDPLNLGWMILRETGIGAVLGLAGHMVFSGIELAGGMVGIQVGFRMATAVNPQIEVQTSLLAQFNGLFALMVLLAINGHHYFLDGVAGSFRLIPLGGMVLGDATFSRLIDLFGELFLIGLKMSAPIIAAMLLTNAALGLMVRAVPQMNIFVIGFPVLIVVGLIALLISLKALAYLLTGIFSQMYKDINFLIGEMR
jgi:flagellar biosynthetic protein FliR